MAVKYSLAPCRECAAEMSPFSRVERHNGGPWLVQLVCRSCLADLEYTAPEGASMEQAIAGAVDAWNSPKTPQVAA
jgi:hypothetical protein